MAGMSYKLYEKVEEGILMGLKILNQPTVLEEIVSVSNEPPTKELSELAVSRSMTCSYCLVSFADINEQRAHYKLDWHRYNLKQALIGLPPVLEENFDCVADDVSSISGSECDDSDSSSDGEEDISDREKAVGRKIACFRDAKIFLENDGGNSFSLYKCLLLRRREVVTPTEVQELVVKFLRSPRKKWMIVMLGGGHFAAAVFDGGNITVHKTFHCYTVRAKQGGSQAARDARGGNHPKSAGASLRRYNELALIQHVQDIMSSWAEEIGQCSLILYRAVGKHNHSVLFGGKNPPLDKTDERLRSIPIATRRATLKEVKRVHEMLSTLQCHGLSSELEKQMSPETNKNGGPNMKSPIHRLADEHFGSVKKKPSPVKLDRAKERSSPEREIPGVTMEEDSDSDSVCQDLITEDIVIDFSHLKETDDSLRASKWKRRRERKKVKLEKKKFSEAFAGLHSKLELCCRTGNHEGIRQIADDAKKWPSRSEDCPTEGSEEQKSVMKREDFNECLKSFLPGDEGNTLLHLAAIERFPAVVTTLLDIGCDPSWRNKKNHVPYEMCGDLATKEAFKEFMVLNPDRYNRKKSHIPEALSAEQKKEQEDRKREKRKQQKIKQKVKGKEAKERSLEEKKKSEWLAEKDENKVATSEEIIGALKVGKTPSNSLRCFQCATELAVGFKPFEYNKCIFCSIQCLKAHRAKTNSYGKEI